MMNIGVYPGNIRGDDNSKEKKDRKHHPVRPDK